MGIIDLMQGMLNRKPNASKVLMSQRGQNPTAGSLPIFVNDLQGGYESPQGTAPTPRFQPQPSAQHLTNQNWGNALIQRGGWPSINGSYDNEMWGPDILSMAAGQPIKVSSSIYERGKLKRPLMRHMPSANSDFLPFR